MENQTLKIRIAKVEAEALLKIYTDAEIVEVTDNNNVLQGFRLVENGAIVAEAYWDKNENFIKQD